MRHVEFNIFKQKTVLTADGQLVKPLAARTMVALGKWKHRKSSTALILCSCITDRGKDEANLDHKKVLNSLYSNLVLLLCH